MSIGDGPPGDVCGGGDGVVLVRYADLAARDVIVFAVMLAQPRPPDPSWDKSCRRLLASYLRGTEESGARGPSAPPRA